MIYEIKPTEPTASILGCQEISVDNRKIFIFEPTVIQKSSPLLR